ncbi:hypothetical protein ILYODFUR_026052 [Ilyodon furcidens]|uniref:Uncharacterized protein n=1 Tax=Ilyodon furcidens TaxID=33524 RepID=A0ABV0UM33_9TELE
MGAQGSSQRDGKIQEDASASASGGELSAGMKVHQEGTSVLDGKLHLQSSVCQASEVCGRHHPDRTHL